MAFSGLGSGTSGDPYQITTAAQYSEMSGAGNAGLYYLLMNDLDVQGKSVELLYCHFDGGNHRVTKTASNNFTLYNGATFANVVVDLVDGTNVTGLTCAIKFVSGETASVTLSNIYVINHAGNSLRFINNNNSATLGTGIVFNGCKIDGPWSSIFGSTSSVQAYDFVILNTATYSVPIVSSASSGFHLERFYFCQPLKSTASTSAQSALFIKINTNVIIRQGYIFITNVDSVTVTNAGALIFGSFDSGTNVFEDVYIKIDKATSSSAKYLPLMPFGASTRTLTGSTFRNILYEGDIDTPNNTSRPDGILSRITPLSNSYYNKDLLVSIPDVDSSGQTGLTTAQILQESNFSGWDFVNVWIMTENGPRLRTISENQTFENTKEFALVIRPTVTRVSGTSMSFGCIASDESEFTVEVTDDSETVIYQTQKSGELVYTVNVSGFDQNQDKNYTVTVYIIINSVRYDLIIRSYFHYILDAAVNIQNINSDQYVSSLNDGVNQARYVHGTVIVNGVLYGSTRAWAGISSWPGAIVKVPLSDISTYSIIPIVNLNNDPYNFMDFMVSIGTYLYTAAVPVSGTSLIFVRYNTLTDTYVYLKFGVAGYKGDTSCTDGIYIYLVVYSNGEQVILKIDPSIFDLYENGSSVDISGFPQYHVVTHYNDNQLGIHSMCVDANYLYCSCPYYGTQTAEPHEVQKINKTTMALVDYCAAPQSTDDMTQNADYLFLGIENVYTIPTTYEYGMGCAAIRKSDLNLTVLPALHKTDTPGVTVSYASTIFGNYLFDCKTSGYIYVVDISDVDNWSINELIGNRTLKAYKVLQPNGSAFAPVINEILRVDNEGKFAGFLWYNPSGAVVFTLTGLTFSSVPEITSVEATVDGDTVELEGYIVNIGAENVSECGFEIGLEPDLSDKESYPCPSVQTAFSRIISGLETEIYYWRAYAINEIGTGYGAIESFIIEELLSPSTETISVTNRTISSAKINAAVTDLGSTSVIDHGVCYSDTNSIPTLNDTVVSLDSINSIGNFYVDLINLIENTRYYVCSYAINSVGVNYGNVLDFWTITKPGIPENISSELIIEVQITFSIPSNLGNGTFLGFKIESKVLNGDWEVLQSLWTETTYACFITGKCWFRFTTITVEYGEGDATEEIEIRTGTDAYRIYLGSNEIIIQ